MPNPVVIGATVRVAQHACRLLGLPAHKHVIGIRQAYRLRGLASNTTFYVVHSDVPLSSQVHDELNIYRALGATIIDTSIDQLMQVGDPTAPPAP